jgi:hypothetical protein
MYATIFCREERTISDQSNDPAVTAAQPCAREDVRRDFGYRNYVHEKVQQQYPGTVDTVRRGIASLRTK